MRKWEPKGGPKTEQNRVWMILGSTLGARGREKGGPKMDRKLDQKKGGFWIEKMRCRAWLAGMCGGLGLCSWQISSKILPGVSHARPLRGRRIQSLRAFRQARVEGIRTKRKSTESLPFKRFGLVGNSMKVCTWGCLEPQILRKSSFVSPRVSQNEPYDTQGGPE